MDGFHNHLKQLRLRRGMKQEKLAERMQVTRQTVSGWETGRRQPDLDTLKKLAEVLNADVNELIYGRKPDTYPKFQKKYMIQTAVLGGILLLLGVFWLLILPRFDLLCATYHWGAPLLICHEVLPFVGCFAAGGLIPSAIQLFVPIRIEKRIVRWLCFGGVLALLPFILFWLGILPLERLILYRIVHAALTYILPFISGICLFCGITGEKV